ncbi:MAG: divergent polysaccharide deacetylase family protein [Synergistaceae bacterium]|nr:divergent polysaccharide deacetylase family protein [Synergistaceae bacterium]
MGMLTLVMGGVFLALPREGIRDKKTSGGNSSDSQYSSVPEGQEKPLSSEEPEEMPAEPSEEEPLPERPWISLVIDDFGFSKAMAEEYGALDLPLTWAIIPFQPQSKITAEIAAAAEIPYIIHMPMGAQGDKIWTEKSGVIDKGMSPETVTLLLRKAVASLPGAQGLNNHRGSRATADEGTMEMVMNELAATPLFFLDSRTSSSSVAYDTAWKKGIAAGYASIFLDNETSWESMEKQFRRGLAMAGKRGWVVMIGHTRTDTLNYLRKKSSIPPEGGTFVTLPVLMELLKEPQHPSSAP